MARYEDADIQRSLTSTAEKLGYSALRPQQELAVRSFVQGNDVFISLPTGRGKSLCYSILPDVFNALRTEVEPSIVIIVQGRRKLLAVGQALLALRCLYMHSLMSANHEISHENEFLHTNISVVHNMKLAMKMSFYTVTQMHVVHNITVTCGMSSKIAEKPQTVLIATHKFICNCSKIQVI